MQCVWALVSQLFFLHPFNFHIHTHFLIFGLGFPEAKKIKWMWKLDVLWKKKLASLGLCSYWPFYNNISLPLLILIIKSLKMYLSTYVAPSQLSYVPDIPTSVMKKLDNDHNSPEVYYHLLLAIYSSKVYIQLFPLCPIYSLLLVYTYCHHRKRLI